MATKAAIKAKRESYAARASEERERRRIAALTMLLSWPEGMPPLSGFGVHIGLLKGLAKDGLAAELARDDLGDPRFVITAAGREHLCVAMGTA